ncbi:MAG TPA: hypothetical protein VNZ52_14525 [Candidatus Thermoplasmatota archaeon]|nr:hypothetical protein [Candidatus Thermoplasmatota archaeon]
MRRNRQALLAGVLALALVAAAVAVIFALSERRRADSAELSYADPRSDALEAWARNLEGAAIPLQGENLSRIPAEGLAQRLRLASVQLNDATYLAPRLFDAEPPATGPSARAFGQDLAAANRALGALAAAAERGNLTADQLAQARTFQRDLPLLAGAAADVWGRVETEKQAGTLRPASGAVTAEEWEALRAALQRLAPRE